MAEVIRSLQEEKMSKYAPLTEWLKRQTQDKVALDFADIERIISDKLPDSARQFFRFWDNTPGAPHNDAWLNAGWRTVVVDMLQEKVTFLRAP
jgi:hypothetical protein